MKKLLMCFAIVFCSAANAEGDELCNHLYKVADLTLKNRYMGVPITEQN